MFRRIGVRANNFSGLRQPIGSCELILSLYKQHLRLYVKGVGQRRCVDWSNHQNKLKKEGQMTRDTDNGKTNVLDIFDKILIKHLKRLIGSNYLTNTLTLNSLIISCLILLMERENEIKNVSSGVSVRYTYETLMSELEEMEFNPDRKGMNIVVQDMMIKNLFLESPPQSWLHFSIRPSRICLE
jgi:hypothetical protein